MSGAAAAADAETVAGVRDGPTKPDGAGGLAAPGLDARSNDWFGAFQALSEFANCLLPLVESLGWRGEPRQLAEALPHFVEDLDIEGFRNALANLGYTSHPLRVRQDRIDPTLLPCLFVPDTGAVRVLLARGEGGFRIFDGWMRREREVGLLPLRGTAYIVRPAEDPTADREQAANDWLQGLTLRFRGAVRRLLAMTFFLNVLSLATPLFIMSVYDTVIPSHSPDQLLYLLAGVALAMLFEIGFRITRARSIAYVAGRIDNIIGNVAFNRLMFLPVSRTENAPVGSQLARLKEFEFVRELFTSPIAEAMLDLPFTLLFLAVIAILGGPLVAVPLSVAVLFVAFTIGMAPRLRRATERAVRARSWLQRFTVEAVSHMRAIKYTGAGARWMERFRDASAASAAADFEVAKVNHMAHAVSHSLMLAAGIAVLGLGALRAMDGLMSVGALVAVMVLGWRVLSPLQAGFVAMNRIEQIRSALRQIGALVRLPTEGDSRATARRPLEGGIRFSWVSHRYSPDNDPVLFGVSFDIEPGEVVALTGANGSGKSTVVKLLTGLYRPQAGAILIDGVDVRQMNPVQLRQRIGVVSQPTHLFYGTVAQNLRLGSPDASRAALVEAAKDAKVYDDIMALPDQFETRLTEAMLGKLPAGFKQKLALARIYLRRSPIMIFDEATQGLDEDGDKAFIAAVQRMRGKATIVIVTHRPSHMRIADRVIVMAGGKLAAMGTPEEILKRKPDGSS